MRLNGFLLQLNQILGRLGILQIKRLNHISIFLVIIPQSLSLLFQGLDLLLWSWYSPLLILVRKHAVGYNLGEVELFLGIFGGLALAHGELHECISRALPDLLHSLISSCWGPLLRLFGPGGGLVGLSWCCSWE